MRSIGNNQFIMRCKLAPLETNLTKRAYLLFCILALALSVAIPFSAGAATTILTLNHTGGEYAIGYPHQRKVVRDADGYWYVAFMDYVGTDYEIFLVKSSNTTGTAWETPVKLGGESGIVYNSTYGFYWPAIDIDRANGALHMVFYRESTNNLYYSQCTDLTNWNQSTSWYRIDGTTNGYDTVSSDAYWLTTVPRYSASIALDSNGGAHVLFITNAVDWPIYIHGNATDGWGAEVGVESSGTVIRAYPVIEVDSNDTVHAVWSRMNNGEYQSVYHKSNDPPYYSPDFDSGLTALGGAPDDLIYTSVAADDGGNVQVIFENDSYSEIWGAYYDGSSWTQKEQIDTLAPGWDKPMLGVKLGLNVIDDIILSADNDTDPDPISSWKWLGYDWDQPETATGETTSGYVSVEKQAPDLATDMGYIVFDAATGDLKFARITGLVAGSEDVPGGGYDQTYNFDDQSGTGWDWSGPSGTGLSTVYATGKWYVFDDATASDPTGPDGPQGGSGYYVYTETSSGTAGDVWTMTLSNSIDASTYALNCSFYLSLDLNTSTPDVKFEVYNGTIWETVATYPNNDLPDWNFYDVDLSAYENSDLQVRFYHQTGGSAYLNDLGIDTVRIYGDARTPTITLGEHTSGQLSDQFDGAASQSAADLFRFQLDNTSGENITVTQIRFQLSGVNWIDAGDLTNLKINDGTSDVSTGADVTITGDTGVIIFDGNFTINTGSTEDYTLIGDAANLGGGDTLTLSLDTTDIVPVSGVLDGSAPTDVTHTTDWPVELQVSASNDDSYVTDADGDAATYISDTFVRVDADMTSPTFRYHGGIRFQNVSVPPSAVIVNARLSFHTYSSSYDNAYFTLYGHDTGNAGDFATNPIIKGRSYTDASLTWGQSGLAADWHDSDVTSIVQEIVNRGDWGSGNAMAFLFIGRTDITNQVNFYSADFDNSPGPSLAPKLYIDYTFVTNIYRSVGTNPGSLYSAGTASIDNGSTTVTFSGGSLPEPDVVGAVGPGDKLVLGSETFYIKSRDSATQVTVQTAATGDRSGTPDITRAYNTISAWESAREAANPDLTSSKTIEVAVCYKDGPMNEKVIIGGFTTGPNNYIKIWVPPGQRHTGTAGTGFVLKYNYSGSTGQRLFQIDDKYVRVEGIEIDGSQVDAPFVYGFQARPAEVTLSDIRFDKVLVHDLTANTTDDQYGARGIDFRDGSSGPGRVTNSIIYNIKSTNPNALATGAGIRLRSGSTVDLYNNTIYNVSNTGSSAAVYGIWAESGTITAINNYVGGTSCSSCGTDNYDFYGSFESPESDYNISEDSTAPGAGSLTDRLPYDDSPACPGANQCVIFQNIDAATEDLHLRNDVNNDALDAGDDLSGAFTDDIDGEVRPTGANTWDIGADEYVVPITTLGDGSDPGDTVIAPGATAT
jgi:hypothetical protein